MLTCKRGVQARLHLHSSNVILSDITCSFVAWCIDDIVQ